MSWATVVLKLLRLRTAVVEPARFPTVTAVVAGSALLMPSVRLPVAVKVVPP